MNGKLLVLLLLAGLVLMPSGTLCCGADKPDTSSEDQQAQTTRSPLTSALLALAAALAVGMCAIGTGVAQSRIGAAGCGTLAERPESATTVILLVAIPETMVILGFVVAIVILFVA
jgi:V/A-type H+-transporting ATPase subunit K